MLLPDKLTNAIDAALEISKISSTAFVVMQIPFSQRTYYFWSGSVIMLYEDISFDYDHNVAPQPRLASTFYLGYHSCAVVNVAVY